MTEGSSQRETRIIDAAANLIAHYGYDKTTVDEIAREAGVSKGAIYLHFKSKQDLFEALLLRETDTLTERFFELIDADADGVTIFNIYRYGLVILDGSPLMKALYTQDRRVLGDYMRHLRNTPAYKNALLFSVDSIRQFQAAGLIRDDLDAEAITYLLTALRYGVLTIEQFTPDMNPPTITQLSDALAKLITNGLEPQKTNINQEAGRMILEKMFQLREQFKEQHRNKPG